MKISVQNFATLVIDAQENGFSHELNEAVRMLAAANRVYDQDVVQDCCIATWQQLGNLQPCSARAYVIQIILNARFQKVRKEMNDRKVIEGKGRAMGESIGVAN